MNMLVVLNLLLSGICALAARVDVNWDVGYLNISRDGYSTWQTIGVNGQLPIPPIYVNQGDVLFLTAHNSLDKPFTLHTHGMFQRNTSYYDGVGMVTECGIPPGDDYTYIIDTAEQVGTYFIHGHYSLEMAEGLRTPFIIREKSPAVAYDEEILVQLEDWGQQPESELLDYLKTISTDHLPNDYKTGLINGIDGNTTQTICFVPGTRYRMRVLNVGLDQSFKFRIPGHSMQIIEADGVDTMPLEVDGLDLLPGQRYSVIVTAHESDAYNFVFNATMYTDFLEPAQGLTPRYYTGIIEYQPDAPFKDFPVVSDDELAWPDDFALQPLNQQPAFAVDRVITLEKKDHLTGFGVPEYGLTNASYAPVLVPTILSALTTGDLAFDSAIYGAQSSVLVLNYMETIELVIQNGMNRSHPMHIHSRVFQVIESGPFGDAAAMGKPILPVRKAGANPMRRDTALLPEFGYLKLRFKADLPGAVSFAHCHTEHMSQGMAVVFVEAPDLLQQNARIPKKLLENCRKLGFKTSGNGAGNQGFDFTGLQQAITF